MSILQVISVADQVNATAALKLEINDNGGEVTKEAMRLTFLRRALYRVRNAQYGDALDGTGRPCVAPTEADLLAVALYLAVGA